MLFVGRDKVETLPDALLTPLLLNSRPVDVAVGWVVRTGD